MNQYAAHTSRLRCFEPRTEAVNQRFDIPRLTVAPSRKINSVQPISLQEHVPGFTYVISDKWRVAAWPTFLEFPYGVVDCSNVSDHVTVFASIFVFSRFPNVFFCDLFIFLIFFSFRNHLTFIFI